VLFPNLVAILDPEPHSAPLNMAIDEVLLQRMKGPALRIYRWSEPAVSFGYFGGVAEAEKVAAGRALVRRWTGGGIVEHGEDVTYTLMVPREHAFCLHSPAESYRLIHEVICEVLAGEGIHAEVVPVADTCGGGECFANPVLYDVVANGRKIAGAAQRRTRWGLLHQGSILAGRELPGFAESVTRALGAQVQLCALGEDEVAAARVLAEEKYGTAEWLRKF
jgi:lipoate-protein ligase A